MSNTVDQRIVKMLFDNAQFEQGINQSISSIDKLKNSLNFGNIGAGASIDSLSSNLSGLSSSVDNISSHFSTMGIAATTWIAQISTLVGDLAGNALQNLTKNAQAGYNRYNEMMESIQTIMYATRNQWDDTEAQMDYVTAQIDKLNWYTDETSYNLSDMTNSIGKFVAAGVSLDDAATAMEGISSWAAISGQNAEKASYAMYNLAQAMAIGKVTTADWKSIENANMATEEFKETVINTAVNLGYLEQYCTDEGEWFTYYAKQTSKGLEEIQVTTENMRTTLQYGWFNSEVLTETLRQYGEFADQLYYAVESTGVSTTEFLGYLDEYQEAVANGADMNAFVRNLASREQIDNVAALGQYLELLSGDFYELGRASFKAAQESKTFKDTMDYTADAITTTWMNIFQDIFGNYLESKELWTAMSELMYEQMVRPLEELEEQLSLWNEKGGADVLKDSFWDLYEAISAVLKAVKQGFEEVFPNNLGINLLRFVRKLSYITEEFKLRDDLFEFEKIKIAASNFAKFLDHILSNLDVIGKAIKKAWNSIFPEKEVNRGADSIINKIRDFSYWLEDLGKKFLLTDEDGKKLERTFAGLFAILDIGRLLLVAIIEPFTKIDTEMEDVSYGILDVTASIGDWLVALRDFIRDNEIFKKAVEWIIWAFQQIPVYLDKLSRQFLGMGLSELLSKIAETAMSVFMVLGGLFVDFEGTIKKVDEVLSNSQFSWIWDLVKNKVTFVWGVITKFFDYLKNNTFGKIKEDALNLFGSTWETLKGIFDKITEKVTSIWNIVSSTVSTGWNKVKDFFGSVSGKISELWSSTSDGSKNIVSRISDFFKSIKDDPGGIWSGIKNKAKETLSFIGDLISQIGKKIGEKFEGTPIGDFFAKLAENAKDLWEKIPEKVESAWGKLKEFFGIVGTTAGDIWDSIPGAIENAWTNITGFVDKVKQNISDIWSKIEPYVSKIADGFKAAGEKIKDNWDTIWPNIVGFFEFLFDKGGAAIDWIINIDWASWWENIKTWCDNTWDSIKTFFEELPEKAKGAFEDLTGTDWETFLDGLSDKWDKLKTKVGEAWDAIVKFFQNIPTEMDKFAQKFGYNSWSDAWDEWTKSISDAYHALLLFFELERPDWMTQNEEGDWIPMSKKEEGSPEGYDPKKGLDGITTYKDIIKSINGFEPDLKEFLKVSPEFKGSINALIVILTLLAVLYIKWQTIKSIKDLAETVSEADWMPFKTSIGTFADSIGDSTENLSKAADKIGKAASWAAIGATLLMIAAALRIIATMTPSELIRSVVVIGAAFGAITAMLYLFGKDSDIKGEDLKKIGEAFALIGVTFLILAGSLAIIQKIPFGQLAASTSALAILFGGLVAAFVILTKFKVEPSTVLDFAVAADVLSLSLVSISLSLMLLQDIPLESLALGALALILIFGELIAALVVLSKTNVDPQAAFIFAGAVDVLTVSLLGIAAAIYMLKDLDPMQIAAAAGALGLLFAAMAVILVLGTNLATTSETGLLAFAGAIAILGVGAMAAAAGVYLIAQAISTIAAIGPEGVNTLIYGIVEFVNILPTIVEGSINALAGVVDAIANLIVGIFAAIGAAIAANAGTITTGLVALWMIFIDTFNIVVPAIVDAIGNFLTNLLDMLINIWPQVEEFLLLVGQTILSLLEQLITGLLNILNVNMPVILSILEQLAIGAEAILEQVLLPGVLTQTEILLQGILKLIMTYTPQITELFFALVINTLQYTLANIGEITALATAIAISIALGFIEGITQEIPEIINTGIDFFLALINGFADAITTRGQEITDAITNLKNAIINEARRILGLDNGSGGEFFKIAADMINNFIEGIQNGISAAVGAVGDLVTQVLDAAKGKEGLDEKSPSKKMHQIGEYASEGLAEGIKDGAKDVLKASQEAAKDSLKTTTDIFSGVQEKISSILEDAEFPVITPVLDLSQITDGAQSINGLFGNMPSLDLAGTLGTGFNLGGGSDPTSMLTDAVNGLSNKITNGEMDATTINNTFNIQGDDPKAIANEVSGILQNQVDRRNAIWA